MREFEGAALIARRRYPRSAMRPTDRSLPCCSVLVRRLVRPPGAPSAVHAVRPDRTVPAAGVSSLHDPWFFYSGPGYLNNKRSTLLDSSTM